MDKKQELEFRDYLIKTDFKGSITNENLLQEMECEFTAIFSELFEDVKKQIIKKNFEHCSSFKMLFDKWERKQKYLNIAKNNISSLKSNLCKIIKDGITEDNLDNVLCMIDKYKEEESLIRCYW